MKISQIRLISIFIAILLIFANAPVANVSAQGEKALIGAIRWDAWYGTAYGHSNRLAYDVENTLSPAEFHFRAPFYALVKSTTSLKIPYYTIDTMRAEIKYAENAGLDYWAFVWNIEGDGPDRVRKFYKQCMDETDLKLTCILTSQNKGDLGTRSEIKGLLADSHWVKVCGGRPLMYYFAFGSDAEIKAEISAYRTICGELGLPNPYVVILGKYSIPNGADAVGDYGIGGKDNEPFRNVYYRAQTTWNRCRPIVPTVTTGWNNEPRIKTQVSFGNVANNSYAQYATCDEIKTHLQNALVWIDKYSASNSQANTVLIYAWNEFDEGGWICPTIAVDAYGNHIKNSDGTNKINTERIDAVGEVLNKYKNISAVASSPTVPKSTESTATPAFEEMPKSTESTASPAFEEMPYSTEEILQTEEPLGAKDVAPDTETAICTAELIQFTESPPCMDESGASRNQAEGKNSKTVITVAIICLILIAGASVLLIKDFLKKVGRKR